ncbi:MAG: copper resistance protein B, partial [Bradyrhizobium sp.]|nr:copper resistance protein B [Bradyrhizobium sp.]
EFTRNIAPYVGVNWLRKLGETASIAKSKRDPIDNLFFVAGVRVLW